MRRKKEKKRPLSGTEIAYRKDMDGLVQVTDVAELYGVASYWIQIPFPFDGLMAKEYMADWLKDVPENLYWRETIIRKSKLETNPKWGYQNLSADEKKIIEYTYKMNFLIAEILRGRVWWQGESELNKFFYEKPKKKETESGDTGGQRNLF